MKIYFAGAIRGGRADAALYHEIVRLLREYGEVLTEHVADSALGVLGQDIGDQKIHKRDLEWLMVSDYLVAEVTCPNLAVGSEIARATQWGKPVLCLFRPKDGRSLFRDDCRLRGGDRSRVSGSGGTQKHFQRIPAC